MTEPAERNWRHWQWGTRLRNRALEMPEPR